MTAGSGSGEDAALVCAVFLRMKTYKEGVVSCDTAVFGIRRVWRDGDGRCL